MIVPGSNVLNMALSIINKQTVIYYHYLGRTTNEIGQYVPQFSEGVALQGSFQPVPRNVYRTFGLDLQRDYFTFYASSNLLDIRRGTSSDHIAFNGQRYQCESNNDWYEIDGWKGVLCIRLDHDWAQKMLLGFNTKPLSNSYVNFNQGNFLGEST